MFKRRHVSLCRLGRVTQTLSLCLYHAEKTDRIKVILSNKEVIRMKHFYSIRFCNLFWKILHIKSYDSIRMANNCRSQDMTIIRIWQLQAIDNGLGILNEAVLHSRCH